MLPLDQRDLAYQSGKLRQFAASPMSNTIGIAGMVRTRDAKWVMGLRSRKLAFAPGAVGLFNFRGARVGGTRALERARSGDLDQASIGSRVRRGARVSSISGGDTLSGVRARIGSRRETTVLFPDRYSDPVAGRRQRMAGLCER